jgi:hypothetical protein
LRTKWRFQFQHIKETSCCEYEESIKESEKESKLPKKDVGIEAPNGGSSTAMKMKAAKAALHPMNSDSEQTSRNDGSTNKHFQKASTSKPPSNEFSGNQRLPAWEVRLSELADYRKSTGTVT